MADFIGRAVEQTQLSGMLEDAIDGRGGLALLAGEPGIGKTALSEQLATVASARAVPVRWGRSPESEGAPPFWPWRQAIGNWPEEDADVDRFAFFEARLDALRELAGGAGVVVVLDDLHWADEGSLRLLEHLAPSLSDTRALVVGTYRDVEVERGGILDRSLGALARHATILPIRGLREVEVGDLARSLQAQVLDADTVSAVAAHTNGNPFFVAQVLRLLESQGRAGRSGQERLGIPPGVGEVVRRRVERLGAETAELLARAAILGRTIDPARLRVVAAGLDMDEAIGAGLDAGLVEAEPARPGSFRFVHALVREVLAADLGLHAAARVHEQILGYLTDPSTTADDLVASRAHHAVGAIAVIGPEAAAPHVLEAGCAALEAGGFEDAVRLAETSAALDHRLRYESLILLGRALFSADDHERSESVLLEAAGLAEQSKHGTRMARALLEIGSGRLVTGSTDLIAARLNDALRLVDEADVALRAELLSRRADMLTDPDEVAATARAGFDLARRSGDAAAIVLAGGRLLLNGSAWMRPDERRAVVDELAACDDEVLGTDARMNRDAVKLLVLLEEGQLDAAAQAADAIAADFQRLSLALRFREPVQVLLALLRGRLDEAGEVAAWLVAETERRGAQTQLGPSNNARYIALLRERDQSAMLVAIVAQLRSAGGPLIDETLLDVLAAIAATDCADREEAVHAIDLALGHDLERWARGWGGNDMALTCLLAEAARETGHAAAGARLAPIVTAVADRNVVLGMPPVFSLGWGSYYLGCCQLLEGRFEAAAGSLNEALARNTAMGALPFVARTHLALAALRLASDDGTGAVEHARAAHGIAVRAGLPALERRAGQQLEALGATTTGGGEGATTTFVFTDIVGSTAATALAGDRAWRTGLDAHTSRVRALAVKHGGRLVKSLGDGFMLTFPTARAGIAFAMAVQVDVAGSPFEVRVGVHTGEAEVVDGDHIGHHVNLAARVSGAAAPGEVLVSDVVRTILTGSREFRFDGPRAVDLKGIPDTQLLYAILP